MCSGADAEEPTAKKRRLDMERVCKSESHVNKGAKRVQRRGKGCVAFYMVFVPQCDIGPLRAGAPRATQ